MGKPRYRYDPGANPRPRRPVPSTSEERSLPIGATRADRRRRAKMTFSEARALAASQRFPVPPEVELTGDAGAGFWTATWEEMYAARAR